MTGELEYLVTGQGYDEKICLTIPKVGVIFDGNCDQLVTSQYGEIELKLNFTYSELMFHHALRRIDKYVVLVPTLHEVDVSQFFSKRKLGTIALLFSRVQDLWVKLRYDPTELNDLVALSSSDYLLLWLLNIPSLPNTLSSNQIISWLENRILAEEPQGVPTIRETLEMIVSGEVRFSKSLQPCQANTKPVIAYIDTEYKSIVEWYALNSLERHKILLGNDWSIIVN
ncbi:hypothetical protein [Nodularia chucula]|uniref:hypothetical protein n=1 Tax=Nodularia chucula TaxID=3093667 RepID=UPI0039C62679